MRAEIVLSLPVPQLSQPQRHFLEVPSANYPISVALGHLPSCHPIPHTHMRGAAQSPIRPLVSCLRSPAEGGSTQGQALCLLSQPGLPEHGLAAAARSPHGNVQTLLPATLPARPLVLRLVLEQQWEGVVRGPGADIHQEAAASPRFSHRKCQRELITCSDKNEQLASSLSPMELQRGLPALVFPRLRKYTLNGRGTEPEPVQPATCQRAERFSVSVLETSTRFH